MLEQEHFRIENLENLPKLERLGFRWNFIKTIENVSHLSTLQVMEAHSSGVHCSFIQELELYDNQISKIENLTGLVGNYPFVLTCGGHVFIQVNLKMLDISHNRLRKIEGLENLPRYCLGQPVLS